MPEEIDKLVAERQIARQEKDWKKSDEIRDEVVRLGYVIEDSVEGQKVRKVW